MNKKDTHKAPCLIDAAAAPGDGDGDGGDGDANVPYTSIHHHTMVETEARLSRCIMTIRVGPILTLILEADPTLACRSLDLQAHRAAR